MHVLDHGRIYEPPIGQQKFWTNFYRSTASTESIKKITEKLSDNQGEKY
jgi:hypothetical protein